jgi:hypothetical protein
VPTKQRFNLLVPENLPTNYTLHRHTFWLLVWLSDGLRNQPLVALEPDGAAEHLENHVGRHSQLLVELVAAVLVEPGEAAEHLELDVEHVELDAGDPVVSSKQLELAAEWSSQYPGLNDVLTRFLL